MTAFPSTRLTVPWSFGPLLIAVVLGLSPSRSGAAPAKTPAGATVPVTMTVATSRNVDVVLDAIGTVTPLSSVTVTSRVSGVLEEVHYTEGQMVKKDDLLAVIDPRPYAAALAQAKGQLARDEAQLANARLDLQRYRAAVEQHAVPEQQAAAAEAAVHAGEGTVQFDRGLVETAQINLDYTRIQSPINGRVGLRMLDPGNIVTANGPAGLVTVTQLAPISVVFTLSQEFLPQVLAGMRGGTPLRVQAYDRSSSKTSAADGVLLTIDNQIDQTTGTFRLKATFPNQDTALWPGEFVNLRFTVAVHQNAVTVPSRAVERGPDGSYVYVINSDMRVGLRNVETTSAGDGLTVIEKGVQPGEHVVLDGQYRLEEGTKVVVQPARQSGDEKSATQQTEY
jgi:membrane fusion protein, multidrug efflux system